MYRMRWFWQGVGVRMYEMWGKWKQKKSFDVTPSVKSAYLPLSDIVSLTRVRYVLLQLFPDRLCGPGLLVRYNANVDSSCASALGLLVPNDDNEAVLAASGVI